MNSTASVFKINWQISRAAVAKQVTWYPETVNMGVFSVEVSTHSVITPNVLANGVEVAYKIKVNSEFAKIGAATTSSQFVRHVVAL